MRNGNEALESSRSAHLFRVKETQTVKRFEVPLAEHRNKGATPGKFRPCGLFFEECLDVELDARCSRIVGGGAK